MKTVAHQLASYASYHRDPRNILTHMVGVPLIVVAVAILLSRPMLALGALDVSPAMAVGAVLAAYYLRLDVGLGAVMAALLALSVWAGHAVAARDTGVWLTCGLGMFAMGWIIQFVGHYYEGRKPAFMDDLVGLAIGPLFVAVEIGFLFGWRDDLRLPDTGASVSPKDRA